MESEVTAFRGWSLVFDGQSYLLASGYARESILWIPGQPLKAECLKTKSFRDNTHVTPDRDCTCGLYAAKEPTGSLGTIIGTVAMWGFYVEHESGWRTEYAYPKSVTSLRCSHCAEVFPWRTMKYRTIPGIRPPDRRCGFFLGLSLDFEKWASERKPLDDSLKRLLDSAQKPLDDSLMGLLDRPQKPLKSIPDIPGKSRRTRKPLLGNPKRKRHARKIWKTKLACEDCSCGTEANEDWLPASHLIVRIEHKYGLEVN